MRPMIARLGALAPHAMAGFIAVIFLDSLRYKFTNHPKTQVIFAALDGWTAGLGAPGLFAQTGLLSQYVIGSIELAMAALLIVGMLRGFRHLQAGGALGGLMVMSGAVSFHLFTPLGIDPNRDGGGLFLAACINLGFCAALLVIRRKALGVLLSRVGGVFAPVAP